MLFRSEPNIFYEALEAGVRAEQLKKEKFLKLEGALKVAEKTSQLMTRKFQEAEAKVLKYKAAADAHAETQRRALETELAQLEAPAASGKKSGKSQKSKSAKVGVVASGDIPEEKEEKARASVSDSGSGLRIKRLTEQCKAEQDKAEKLAADLNAARALCEAQKEQLQVLEAKLQQNNLNKAKQAADLVRHKEELQELKAELKELKKELEQKSALIRSLEGAIRLRDFDLKEQAQVIQAMDEKLATQTLKHKKMRAAFEAALAQKKSDLAEQVFLVRQSLKAYREQSRDLGAQKREIADLKIQLERLRGENDELISGNLDLHRQYLAQFNPYQDHTAKSELVKIPMPGGGLLSVSVPPAISEACLSPRGMAHQGGAAVPVGAPSSFKTLKASAAEWVPGSTSPGGRAGGASALAFIAHPAGGAAALGSPARSWLGVVQSAQPAQFS